MDIYDLRELIEKTDDKLSIFKDRETLIKYNMNVSGLANLINDFLNDDEKAELFTTNHFKNAKPYLKKMIINSITDEKLKMELLLDFDVTSNFSDYEIRDVIESLNDDLKIKLIKDSNFLNQHNIKSYEIKKMILNLEQESKYKLLLDSDYLQNELKLESYSIAEIIGCINDEDKKIELIGKYGLKQFEIAGILKSFSDKAKLDIILKNDYDFDKNNFLQIIASLNIENLLDFIKNNKEFMIKNRIEPYEIVRELKVNKEIEFASYINDLGLNEKQIKQIIVNLKDEAKENIDFDLNLSNYKELSDFKVSDEFETYGKIIVDFNIDLEKYKDLDELLYVNPMNLSDEERGKLLKLCDICPKIGISDNINFKDSDVLEYKNGEEWIESVLSGINENWTQIQKVAYIDNAIGKKISYSPDFDTEVFNKQDARTLWKIIDSGYGVCNGIAQVEKYILGRIGVESEMVSGTNHAFLKLKNISLPNKDGEYVSGDTILDPTWNLTAHRFGGRPYNFCKSYKEIRKEDIDDSGKDIMCHKNDNDLESATLNLEEDKLREIFRSIGIADRDGNFPIKKLIEENEKIYKSTISNEEKINKQFELIEKYCPEFATCQNSTMSILEGNIFDSDNIDFNRCIINRVYEKNDENKEAVLYVCLDLPDVGKKFYFADKKEGHFVELPKKEFEERFECYEADMERLNGHREWEDIEVIKKTEDLTKSSGKVVAMEGEAR